MKARSPYHAYRKDYCEQCDFKPVHISQLDVDQFPAYPIGNINITESNFGTNITNYTIELTVADKIKNKNNESSFRYSVPP